MPHSNFYQVDGLKFEASEVNSDPFAAVIKAASHGRATAANLYRQWKLTKNVSASRDDAFAANQIRQFFKTGDLEPIPLIDGPSAGRVVALPKNGNIELEEDLATAFIGMTSGKAKEQKTLVRYSREGRFLG